MNDTIAVVKPHYLTEKAYKMGFERFQDLDGEETEGFDLAPFKSGAHWSNTLAPKLRAMAGYDDRGHGTYTDERQVAAIVPGAEEDEPAEAELTDAHHIYTELVKAFDRGAYDAAEGREQEPPEVPV